MRVGRQMPNVRPVKQKKPKRVASVRGAARPHRARPKLKDSVAESADQVTEHGGIGLRVDITAWKQSEESFRLLFDGNPVPMIVCALDDESILDVNDAAIRHYGYGRAEFEKLSIRSLQALDGDPPWAGDRTGDLQAVCTWTHVKADGELIDLAIYSRRLLYDERPAVLLALMDVTERKRAEAGLRSWRCMTV